MTLATALVVARLICTVALVLVAVTLRGLRRILTRMSTALDILKADVAALKTTEESAVALLNGLAQQVRTLANQTPAASADDLNALAATIEASTADLAAAVSANTSAPVQAAPPAVVDAPPAEPGL